VNVKGEKNSW